MNRGGFATIFALVLMGIVAAALTTMAVTLHVDQKRTQSAHAQAALRQLLLAGATDVEARAHNWPAAPVRADWSVDLPSALQAKNAQLTAHLQPVGADSLSVQIKARIDGHDAQERILFHRVNAIWKVVSASLVDLGF